MSNSVFKSPTKLLWPLISLIPIFLVGIPLMGTTDAFNVLRWFLVLFVFALIALPVSVFIFKGHRSGGFFLSTIVGLLSVGLIVWTLAYMKIPVFNFFGILLVMLAVAGVSYGIKPLRDGLIKKLSEDNVMIEIAFEETIFALCLTILCFYKGMFPDINGQEKFMNYGFIMSMLRSSVLPANDMWLSGYSINYYYFGQYIYTLLFKVSGIKTGVGYTVSMCSAIAIPFAMCYSIGTYMIDTARNCGLRASKYFSHIAGLLAAFCTMIFGNSHSFFYDTDGLGNSFLAFLQRRGHEVGRIDNFFYPDSTRFIGYNPDSAMIEGIQNGGDYTIEEFPFYSYLVGDLHAHVVSTMVVLLIMAVCIAAINRISTRPYGEPKLSVSYPLLMLSDDARKNYVMSEITSILTPEIIACGVLLGCAQMTNYWDFLIYFIFCSMTLLVVMTHNSNVFSNVLGACSFGAIVASILIGYLKFGNSPFLHVIIQAVILIVAAVLAFTFPCALSRTSFGMSFIFTAAHIIALSFNSNFDMISNTLGKCVNHSSLFQLWILWGTHVCIGVAFIVFTICIKNYTYATGKKSKSSAGSVYGAAPSDYPNPIARFFGERNIVDIFVCGMVVVGILLLIAPEIFYVRDIYTGGYLRSNTMFKFTYAGFIILSVAMSYAIIRLFWTVGKKGGYSTVAFIASIVFALMLFVPAHYTIAALNQRCGGNLTKSNYKTLDGTAYVTSYSSPNLDYAEGNLIPYMECVNWFNNNVSGAPVILESYGDSYTDYNFVSAYAGLPTVCGWQTHEWLWRFHGIVDEETDLLISDPEYDVWAMYLTPRHNDIQQVYTAENADQVMEIVNKYHVRYIVLGDLERAKFNYDNTEVISSCGNIVFSYGNLIVVETNPA